MEQPTVSVITVVYNAKGLLPETFQSVFAQTYPYLEYVVVDGASTDGTRELVADAATNGHVHVWTSEADKGIYDAMNKGLAMASGDFVWFINAGDRIHAPDTLERAFAAYAGEDVLYGDVQLLDEAFRPLAKKRHKALPKRLRRASMRHGMVVCHQALLVRRALAPPYDLRYPIAGDIDWTVRVLTETDRVRNTGLILADFLEGGESAKRRRKSWHERWHILRRHFGLLPAAWAHTEIVAWALVRRMQGR